MSKQQILVIHGGGSFIPHHGETMMEVIASKEPELERMRRYPDWKAELQNRLGNSYDILAPKMPNSDAPQYAEWKLWFEKIIPLLDKNVVFIGHSLGAMFLSKYFSEDHEWGKAAALFLVAPPYNIRTKTQNYGWDLENVGTLSEHAEKIFFYHSKDDVVVDFSEQEKFKEVLPSAIYRELDGRGHFNKNDFSEIVEDIKNL